MRLRVLPVARLRDLQKMLVTWLGLSFPKYSATVTGPDGNLIDNFNDKPFESAQDGYKYVVQGELTSDMYFFDVLFRSGR